MMESVHVGLGERAYDVHIGSGLLSDAGTLIAPLLHRPKVAIISDETVADAHLKTLTTALDRAEGDDSTPAGERSPQAIGVISPVSRSNAKV